MTKKSTDSEKNIPKKNASHRNRLTLRLNTSRQIQQIKGLVNIPRSHDQKQISLSGIRLGARTIISPFALTCIWHVLRSLLIKSK